MNARTKSVLYTLSFWGGLTVTCVGAGLFGLAGSIGEYLIAIAVAVLGAFILYGAHKLNPTDVDEFFQHASWDGKKSSEKE